MRKKLSEIQPGERFASVGRVFVMVGAYPHGYVVYRENGGSLDQFNLSSGEHEFQIIEPTPEPKYRPFANAEEFKPHRDKWWKWKTNTTFIPPQAYGDNSHYGITWKESFDRKTFDDGTPFGVLEE